jgi:hypothetical protein
MFGFHYCFNDCVGRETGWRTCGSLNWAEGCVGSPFSQEQWGPSNVVDGLRKVATYGDCPQEAYVGHMWTGVENVRVILVGFSPVGCTSIRIAATRISVTACSWQSSHS